MRVLAQILCVLALVGCDGTRSDPYRGLEPLEDNPAELPAATPEHMHPEALNIEIGSSGYDFGYARGYIHGSVDQVWEALSDPLVVTDRGRNSDYQSFELVPMPEWDLSYTISYIVEDILTVDWTETWAGVITDIETCREEGNDDCDELPWALIRYQKTEGTTFIPLIEGTITLVVVEDLITEIQFVKHLDAAASDETDIRQTFLDQYTSIVARVHGQPLPRF